MCTMVQYIALYSYFKVLQKYCGINMFFGHKNCTMIYFFVYETKVFTCYSKVLKKYLWTQNHGNTMVLLVIETMTFSYSNLKIQWYIHVFMTW